MKEKTTAIELRGITKVFGTVLANDSIDLIAYKGEILALLGENGSGKTTLMNMLSGIYKPDGGEIFVNGQSVIINSPEDSKRLKIGMVYQHYKLVESFTAADNIWISAAHENYPLLTGERYEKIRTICDSFGFEIDPKKIVGDMAVSEKQTVEILKVLYNGADILILDEPTAVLTLQETKKLFAILRKMRDAGCAIIIITHKLNEVMDISDRVTILRKGKSVATVETSATTAKELTDLMMGHAINLSIEHPEVTPGEILLELDGVTVKGEEGTLALDNVSFELKSGEILGVAGVSGCGQKELCDAIAGLQALENGKILFKGESIEGKSPRDIIHRGISMSFIPEDRLGMGLAASLDITNNMMLKNYRDGHSPLVNRRKAIKEARHVVRELGIITPSISTPVRRLSGGNVQKVLLGREMLSAPQVMITAYPVRGLDINSSYTIYNILNREKEKGTGVLYVGEDLDVMLELCDRILVLCHGKLTGIVNARESSKEELGLLMTDANNAVNLKEDSDGSVAVSYTPPAINIKASKKTRRPLLHLVRRPDLTWYQTVLTYTVGILVAVLMGSLVISLNHVNPLEYFKALIEKCFMMPQGITLSNNINLQNTLRMYIPLVITSLGIACAFKMKFWNIGANGQFTVGCMLGAWVGLIWGDSLPHWAVMLLMALVAIVGTGILGLIPALCKEYFGTSETLLTLMFNYIAMYVLFYLKKTYTFGKLNFAGVPNNRDYETLPENAWLGTTDLGSVTVDNSLFVALVLIIIIFIYFKFTKQGYEITVVGDSRNTARYAGMNVKRIVFRTMFLSAAIVGLGGMLQVSGFAAGHRLGGNITADVGWTGIIVAWLAKLNPVAIAILSLLIVVLQKGATSVESNFPTMPSSVSNIFIALFLFTLLATDFFMKYKLVVLPPFQTKGGKEA